MVGAKPSKTSDSDGEPTSKRAKLRAGVSGDNIEETVQRGGYASLLQFVTDVKAACSELLVSAESKGSNALGTVTWKFIPDTLEQDRAIADIKAFSKFFISLTNKDHHKRLHDRLQEDTTDANGKSSGTSDEASSKPTKQGRRGILTMFGHADGRKQLYSSLQDAHFIGDGLNSHGPATGAHVTTGGEPLMPLRENGLPTGITSTKVVPVSCNVFDHDGEHVPLIGDIFPPPANTPALERPITSKHTTAGPILTWTKESSSQTVGRQATYSTTKLPTPIWLRYSGPSQETLTSTGKRKQRDRALSTGEDVMTRAMNCKGILSEEEEEALFYRCYSSFAPTYDSSNASVSIEDKNMVYWHRYGKAEFERLFPIVDVPNESADAQPGPNFDESGYAEAVAAYDPDTFANPFIEPGESNPQPEVSTNEIDETLRRISEKLHILYSHQRLRNMSTTTNARLSTTPRDDIIGTPKEPSRREKAAYVILRDEIARLVSSLPPYAVAKVNGDQLADLNISSKIILESKDYKGVMEEDIPTRAAKAAAQVAAAATSAGSSGLGRPATHQAPKSAQRGTAQYSSNTAQAPLARSGSNYLRQNITNWQSSAANYAQGVQRQGYAQTPVYGQAQQTAGGRPPLSQYIQRGQAQQQSNAAYRLPIPQPAHPQRTYDYYRNPTPASQQSPRPGGTPQQVGTPQRQVRPQGLTQGGSLNPNPQTPVVQAASRNVNGGGGGGAPAPQGQ